MISIARPGGEPALFELWSRCFEDSPRSIRCFFNNAYRPENCLVYRVDDETAAMVNLLPAEIAIDGRVVPAHYIYAAATLPEYRGRGYMAGLLEAAANSGVRRRQEYSLVLPATPQLYKLYGKAGYESVYRTDISEVPAMELQSMAEGRAAAKTLATYAQLLSVRNAYALRHSGSAVWDANAFFYAVTMNRLDSGKLITARSGSAFGYALAKPKKDRLCEVTELFADAAALPALCANLLAAFPAKTYLVRQPLSGKKGPSGGVAFGMAKALNGAKINFSQGAYLGLTLD